MKALDPLKARVVFDQLAEQLPETLQRVGEIIAHVSDNALRLKLEVMRQNLVIYQSKLAIARLLLESEHELTVEVLRDLSEMQNKLVEINYDLAEVVSSSARSAATEKLVDGLVSFVKKHPEVLALPFSAQAAGTVWLTKKLLKRGKKS